MPKKEANDLKIAIKSCFTMLVEDTTLIQNAATPTVDLSVFIIRLEVGTDE